MNRLLALLLVLSAACTGQVDSHGNPMTGDDQPMPDATEAPDAVMINPAVARGQLWVDAKVPYCQAANHKPDNDAACSSTCTRPDNPDWDAYRSDCSGFVSWAWDLPAPGRTTSTFAPANTDITTGIMAADLVPGDAVINDHHMMLFVEWATPGEKATFMEEPGCSSATPYAHEFSATVTLDGQTIVVTSHGTFTAIRYTP